MREVFKIRLFADDAAKLLPKVVGSPAGIALKLDVAPGTELFEEIGRVHRALRAERGHGILTSWTVRREYSTKEIATAEAFSVDYKRVFEPSGEECGTVYDEAAACPQCGSGAPQVTPLKLKMSSIPKGVDIAITIAGEVVASARTVNAFERNSINGVRFDALQDPSRPKAQPKWFQLVVLPPRIDIDDLTQVGWSPFNESRESCQRGDLLGPNSLSEIFIRRPSALADVMQTRQFIGVRRGVLRPNPVLIVTQRVRQLVESAQLKGWRFEVAHFV